MTINSLTISYDSNPEAQEYRCKLQLIDEDDRVVAEKSIGETTQSVVFEFPLSQRTKLYPRLIVTQIDRTDINDQTQGVEWQYITCALTITPAALSYHTYIYSNRVMKLVWDETAMSHVEYRCDEDEFGIPFSALPSGVGLAQTLPFIIHSPQFKQKEEVYEKLSGEQVVLYAAAAKEYALETEYLPQEWHDMFMKILMCDKVTINGISVHKSGDYDIDWDNYTTDDCGNKIVRATCKVKQNLIHRNSNY